jgi:hypothetical protein
MMIPLVQLVEQLPVHGGSGVRLCGQGAGRGSHHIRSPAHRKGTVTNFIKEAKYASRYTYTFAHNDATQ